MNRRIIYSLLFICFFLFSTVERSLVGQEEINKNETFGILSFNIGYGMDFPSGDLKDRYGDNLKFAIGGQYLTINNWSYEFEFSLMFGDEVKEDVLVNFRNKTGSLIGANGDLADVFSRERGFFMGGLFGKIFTKPFKQNGIKIAAGAGVLSHNIRFLDESGGLFQLNGDYLKGYDRLTRGFATKQQLGYEHHSKNGRINFSILFEFTQGFTKNVREYQFDTGKFVTGKRLDLLYSLKGTYMLPIMRNSSIEKPIYY